MPDISTVKAAGMVPRNCPPTHLYHATKAPVVVFTNEDLAQHEADGYSREYIPREYPKHIDGKLVASAEEEAALKGGA